MNAAYAGAPVVVELLLKRDEIDINASDNVSVISWLYNFIILSFGLYLQSGTTALMNAALCGDIKVVKLLLKRQDIDVKAKDNGGKTALDFAKERGVEEVIKAIKSASSLAGQTKKMVKRISSRFSLAR